MLTSQLRWVMAAFAVAVKFTSVAPVPCVGAMVSPVAIVPDCVHAQPAGALTVSVDVPPDEPNVIELAETREPH